MINIIWNLRSHSSNIKDPWSQITITDTIITKSLRYFENYQNVTQTKSEQMLSGKWRDRHSQCKTATQLWWVKKNTASARRNKAKQGIPVLNFSVCQGWGAWNKYVWIGIGTWRLHFIGKCNKWTNCWIYKAQLQIISILVVGLNWPVGNYCSRISAVANKNIL